MSFSLFVSPLHQAYPDKVDDASMSKDLARFVGEEHYNVLYQRIEQFELDAAETRAITFANYTRSEWTYLILKVVGVAMVTTTGKDYDGSTDITGNLTAQGTSLFPGILILSSYNIDTFSVEALTDGTKVQLFAGIAAADDDTRLD